MPVVFAIHLVELCSGRPRKLYRLCGVGRWDRVLRWAGGADRSPGQPPFQALKSAPELDLAVRPWAIEQPPQQCAVRMGAVRRPSAQCHWVTVVIGAGYSEPEAGEGPVKGTKLLVASEPCLSWMIQFRVRGVVSEDGGAEAGTHSDCPGRR